MAGMYNELRFALRGLARSPGFTLITVITLALGVGATTAVFTLVDSVLLRPLPYPDSERLLTLEHVGREGGDELPMSTGLYLLYEEHARTLGSIALYQDVAMNLTGEGEAERVEGQLVTPSLFEVLRVAPALGRPLLPSDAEPGAEPVAVLSHGLWQSRFGGDRAALESTLLMNGIARRVVGVMPRGFAFPDPDARFWTPLAVDPDNAPLGSFGAGGVARMSDGGTVEEVHDELRGIIGRLDQLVPEAGPTISFLREVDLGPVVSTLKDSIVGDLGRTLWTLLGMVGFVLLIACANVANLLLVRAEGRKRELAVRVAVGAGRGALVRPFLAESLGLALAGGILGVGIAHLAVRTTVALAPADLPRMGEVALDLRVLAFTAVLSLLSALVFGMFRGALRAGGSFRRAQGGWRPRRHRGARAAPGAQRAGGAPGFPRPGAAGRLRAHVPQLRQPAGRGPRLPARERAHGAHDRSLG